MPSSLQEAPTTPRPESRPAPTGLTRLRALTTAFGRPLLVLLGILVAVALDWAELPAAARVVYLAAIALGSYPLVIEVVRALRERRYALDYLAILAIAVALLSEELLVAAVIALMLASGTTLESYGVARARSSLTRLVDRLPNEVLLWQDGRAAATIPVDRVAVGQEILVRKGEVIALDGVLVSDSGLTDESSLTGEPYEIEKLRGDQLRSGTVNIGEPLVMRVTRTGAGSTYHKIIEMVRAAQEEKSPLVRLADRYSTMFTAVALAIAGLAYLLSGDMRSVLAVLVIATPCPLILATPIALLGGVNAAARRRIIVKRLAAVEALARVDTLIFDKTGTITLGRPALTAIQVFDPELTELRVLAIAAAIERSSLHPIAKAIVAQARERGAPALQAVEIQEQVGAGISGVVEGRRYRVARPRQPGVLAVELTDAADRQLAVFRFEEELKPDSRQVIDELKALGFRLHVFTGDREASAARVVERLGGALEIRAECTPADKLAGLAELKRERHVTGMVGDGINDAPALAQADVGMVFSNEEQTASSEAADLVFLDGDFALVRDSIVIARRAIRVALQSILWGIGLSVVGMLFAAFGYIPPLAGAAIQEAIDVAVILNALRASR